MIIVETPALSTLKLSITKYSKELTNEPIFNPTRKTRLFKPRFK